MKTLFDSLVRTFTPIVVGAVLAWFTTADIKLDPEFETALTLAVGGAFAGLYYLAVRLFELYVSPKFGWLLGLAKAPTYAPEKAHASFLLRIPSGLPGANATQNDAAVASLLGGGHNNYLVGGGLEAKIKADHSPTRDEILASLEHLTPSEREADIQAAASRINK